MYGKLEEHFEVYSERAIARYALILVSFFQERAIEEQPPSVRTEPAEESDSNGE